MGAMMPFGSSKRQGLRRSGFVRVLVISVFCLAFVGYNLRPVTEHVAEMTQNLQNGQSSWLAKATESSPECTVNCPLNGKTPAKDATKGQPSPEPHFSAPEAAESKTEPKLPVYFPSPPPKPVVSSTTVLNIPSAAPIAQASPLPVGQGSGLEPKPANNATVVLPPVMPNCSIDASRLGAMKEKYDLQENVEYGQRYIQPRRQEIDRKSVTRINADLFPSDFELIDIMNPPAESQCWAPLEVTIPMSRYPKSVDASDLLFGISTTYARLSDPIISPIHEWAHWLTDGNGNSNGGGLILRLVDASDEQINATSDTLHSLGIDAQVFHSNSSIEMAQRYLSLLPALYQDTFKKERKWLVMCDDDTFFPSMHALLDRLAKFNHKSDLYIGTFSEDVNNIQRHGSQAFGGAGVFFTLHMASVVNEFYDDCSTPEKVQESNTGWGPQGDILLRKCIYENTEVRLTLLPALHQLDIMGDPAGFYESGQSPLSLHHFKGGIWHKAKPYQGSKVIPVCGEACFLQRFLFADDFIITNGYSVAYYPKGIQFDLNQMERTFVSAPDDYGWNLDFMMGPGRQSLAKTGRKVAWDLEETIVNGDGSVRQVYVRHADDPRWTETPNTEQPDGQPMFEIDGIMELIWLP